MGAQNFTRRVLGACAGKLATARKPDRALAPVIDAVLALTSTSNSALARACGVGPSAVSGWRTGRRAAPPRALAWVAALSAGAATSCGAHVYRLPCPSVEIPPALVGDVPIPGDLSIDKLALVGEWTPPWHAVMGLWRSAGAEVSEPLAPGPREVSAPRGFARALAAPAFGLSLYCEPQYVNVPPVRFECNPSRFSNKATEAVAAETIALLGLEAARITRLDVAVDFAGIVARDLYAELLRARRRLHWTNAEEGDGFYVGARSSERMLRVYDRPDHRLRFEAQVKPTRRGSALRLPDLPGARDPFDAVELWTCASAVPTPAPLEVAALLDRARAIGLSTVLQELEQQALPQLRSAVLCHLEVSAFRTLEHPSIAFAAAFRPIATATVAALVGPVARVSA